jgi:hypothetical protein
MRDGSRIDHDRPGRQEKTGKADPDSGQHCHARQRGFKLRQATMGMPIPYAAW